MMIRVGGVLYSASPSFLTILRYRLMFDQSYLEGQGDGDELIGLVYVAIDGDKPDYYTFRDKARSDRDFWTAARSFRQQLLRTDGPMRMAKTSSDEAATKTEYEYTVVSVWAMYGLPHQLLGEMTLAQATRLMQTYIDIKNPEDRPKPMSREQRTAFYGISPDREAQVLEYLKTHPEKAK